MRNESINIEHGVQLLAAAVQQEQLQVPESREPESRRTSRELENATDQRDRRGRGQEVKEAGRRRDHCEL